MGPVSVSVSEIANILLKDSSLNWQELCCALNISRDLYHQWHAMWCMGIAPLSVILRDILCSWIDTEKNNATVGQLCEILIKSKYKLLSDLLEKKFGCECEARIVYETENKSRSFKPLELKEVETQTDPVTILKNSDVSLIRRNVYDVD